MKKLLNNVLKNEGSFLQRPYRFASLQFFGLVLIDQLSKLVVLWTKIIPVYFNKVVAFSLPIPWFIPWIIITIVLCYLFTDRNYYLKIAHFFERPSMVMFAVGMIVGGGFSNLLDRFFYSGSVIDFIDLRFWPVFNFADSFIVCGVLLFLYTSYIKTSIVKNS